MADNDRFIVVKESELGKLFGGYFFPIKDEDAGNRLKLMSEYEAIVLETINYECSSVLNEIKSVNTKEIAKAVVDRLFGVGE